MHLPYTGLKAIHDQQIQEALERHRLNAGQPADKQRLLQTLAQVLARFTAQSGQKQESSPPGCAQIEVLLNTTPEDMQTLCPSTLGECDAACV